MKSLRPMWMAALLALSMVACDDGDDNGRPTSDFDASDGTDGSLADDGGPVAGDAAPDSSRDAGVEGGVVEGGVMDGAVEADAGGDAAPTPSCGNGTLDEGEACDTAIAEGEAGACPTECTAPESCQQGRVVGDGCSTECVFDEITTCMDGDGCCPDACGTETDNDCSTMCGDGRIDSGELCDGNCPTLDACDDGASCTADTLSGSAGTCDAQCGSTPIETCTDDDGCCGLGCTDETDNDCSASCGNEVVDEEEGETCDGDCPTECNDENACTVDTLIGSPDRCNVECSHSPITSCLDDDGCCAPGCDATNDNDCAAECGNGIVESGEECDSDSLPTATCNASCEEICVWVVEYETDSEITLTEAATSDANGDYPQPERGTVVYMFTDDGDTPGDGPMGILYTYTPTDITIDALLNTTITTDVVVESGSPSNMCPLATGTMTGGVVTWDACTYVGADWGSPDWTPDQQQVPEGEDAGCLPVESTGNVNCSGSGTVCGIAGLEEGDNPQSDAWDQPLGLTTFDFTGFASGTESSFAGQGTAYDGSPYYPDDRDSPTPEIAQTKTESPTHASSRLWRGTQSLTEVSRACVPPPTDCP